MLAGEAKVRLRLATKEFESELKTAPKKMGGFLGGFKVLGKAISSAFSAALGPLLGIVAAVAMIQRIIGFIKRIWEGIFKAQDTTKQQKLLDIVTKIKAVWDYFLKALGKTKLWDNVVRGAQMLLDWLLKMQREGKIDDWAQKIGDAVGWVIGKVQDLLGYFGDLWDIFKKGNEKGGPTQGFADVLTKVVTDAIKSIKKIVKTTDWTGVWDGLMAALKFALNANMAVWLGIGKAIGAAVTNGIIGAMPEWVQNLLGGRSSIDTTGMELNPGLVTELYNRSNMRLSPGI